MLRVELGEDQNVLRYGFGAGENAVQHDLKKRAQRTDLHSPWLHHSEGVSLAGDHALSDPIRAITQLGGGCQDAFAHVLWNSSRATVQRVANGTGTDVEQSRDVFDRRWH